MNAFHTCLLDKHGYKIGIEALVIKHSNEQYFIGFRQSEEFGRSNYISQSSEQSELHSISSTLSAHATGSAESVPINPSNFRQMFLLIDVEHETVCAASAGLQEAVGLMLQELFPSPSTILLLKRLQAEGDFAQKHRDPLSLNLFSFSEMPVKVDGKDSVIAGAMQVLQHICGSSHVPRRFSGKHVGWKLLKPNIDSELKAEGSEGSLH